jgi:adenylate kinase family enzyme
MSEQSQPESHQNVDVNDSSISKSNVGQVIGGNLTQIQGEVINVTVYDKVDVLGLGSRQTSGSVKPLTQQDYRNRKVLLNKVKKFWIEGVLEKSLHIKALIELGLEERLDAVERPFQDVQEIPDESRRTLPSGTDATQVFNQMGEGRTLLILGEPGAGKTTILLKLAQNLITRTEEDLSQLIPVVFNLSSWASERQPIADWLIGELNTKYQVSKKLGKAWIEEQQQLLLLDGLDEVKAERREACVHALNQFMQEHGQTEMVVCSRIRDYEALSVRLKLQGAIYIQSLTPEQINQYLERAGEQLEAVKTLVQEDTALQELAKSPLTLSVMTLAYQGILIEDLPKTGSLEERRKHLFNAYIERMFQRRGTAQGYSKAQAIHWLIWLAQRISKESQTIFLIERMQPTWLQTKVQKTTYLIANILISSSTFGLISGLISGLITGLMYELINWLVSRWSDRLFDGLFLGFDRSFGDLLPALNLGVISGLIFGLGSGFSKRKIKTVELLKWSWKKSSRSLILGVSFGAAFGLIVVLVIWFIRWLIEGWPTPSATYDLISGLFIGLIGGLIYGLTDGLKGSQIEAKTIPNQGIRRSAMNAGVVGLNAGFVGLVGGWVLTLARLVSDAWLFGLIVGLNVGLISGGGAACIQHFTLRLILYRNGFIPWNYARFLDYATDRIFLQKVGGGYIFIHSLLLEHFAQMEVEQVRR